MFMRSWIVFAAAGLALLPVVGRAGAQVPGQPAPAPAAEVQTDHDVPPEVAESIVVFFNDPSVIHFSGRTRIPAERTVVGDVAVLGGPLLVAGRVEGSVVVLDGEVELAPGAVITGDLTVVGGSLSGLGDAVVEGEVRTYTGRIRFRRFGDRIMLERERVRDEEASAPDRWLARSDFLIASGRSYNRVEGMPITLGPVIETSGSNPLRLRALAIYRTESGATLDPERLGYYVRAEQFVGGWGNLRVGGTLHSTIEPIEDWHVLNLENSLSTFLFHRDFRDHYEREGWSAFVTLESPRSPWMLNLVGRSERHGSQAAGSPWTLFRNHESWRPQPLAAEGRTELLALEGRYDTRSSVPNPSHGWLVSGVVERTLRSTLARPEAVLVAPLPVTDPVRVPAETFPGWMHGLIDVRRYNRLSPEARLNLRLLVAGSLDGSPLPPQRQHALGGEGSLPGYSLFRLDCGARAQPVFQARSITAPIATTRDAPPVFVPAYGCDQVALFQAEYRGKLSLRFGWGGSPWGDGEGLGWDMGWAAAPDWVAFVDAGRGWGIGRRSEDMALDLGFGLLFNRVGVYAAAPLTGEGGVNLFVRLGPRF
jgi:hypothetical protein